MAMHGGAWMHRSGTVWTAAWLAVGWLCVGCAAAPTFTIGTPRPSAMAGQGAPSTPGASIGGNGGDAHQRGHGHDAGPAGVRAAGPALPADFPPDVPVPAGTLVGRTGSAGRWGVLLLVGGPPDQVLASALAFYVAAGFTAT